MTKKEQIQTFEIWRVSQKPRTDEDNQSVTNCNGLTIPTGVQVVPWFERKA